MSVQKNNHKEVIILSEQMTEEQMQQYANQQEGYEVEFLLEYAMNLGYEADLKVDELGKETYHFYKKGETW